MEQVFSPVVSMSSAPYPKVTGPNDPASAAMLKEDYAGAHGELTGILQYTFQHVSGDSDESFANALLRIAIVEMKHLELLGKAITALGGVPTLDDGRYYWDASKVSYAKDMRAMLAADIQAEKTAIANYQAHAARTGSDTLKALLLRIVQDEQLHLRFFEETLAGLE
ncbi:MAG: manganese catalase family protein [Oscillospiraceae bacterium]|nr:manganese catalase family protein [Oscillospiraceae bacterium]